MKNTGFLTNISFWKSRMWIKNTANEIQMTFEKKKKKTISKEVALRATICGSQGCRELGGAWEVSFFFSLLHQD